MPDARDRLTKCFEAVFPGLDSSVLAAASQDTVAEWDSVAWVQLIAVIEEEFEIAIPVDDYERLTSFREIEAYLRAMSA